jgi:hypothetical protein
LARGFTVNQPTANIGSRRSRRPGLQRLPELQMRQSAGPAILPVGDTRGRPRAAGKIRVARASSAKDRAKAMRKLGSCLGSLTALAGLGLALAWSRGSQAQEAFTAVWRAGSDANYAWIADWFSSRVCLILPATLSKLARGRASLLGAEAKLREREAHAGSDAHLQPLPSSERHGELSLRRPVPSARFACPEREPEQFAPGALIRTPRPDDCANRANSAKRCG